MSAKPARPRRWRKWCKRIAILAVVLIIVGRLSLALWLPSVLASSVAGLGLDATYEDFDLSMLGGDVELRHVDVRDSARPDAEPLAHIEYARLDIDISALWLFDLRVHRVEVDGLDVHLERAADGKWILPSPEASETEGAPEEVEVEPEDAAEPQPWDLSSPVQLDAVRIQHARVQVKDAYRNRDTYIEAQFRASDLGHPTRPMRIAAHVFGPDVVDALTFEASGRAQPQRALLDAELMVRGLRPGAFADVLQSAGVRPEATRLGARLALHVGAESAADTPQLDVQIGLDEFRASADSIEGARIGTVFAAATLRPGEIDVAEVRLTNVGVETARTTGGVLRALGFGVAPDEGGAPVAMPDEPAPEAPVASSEPFRWRVRHIEVENIDCKCADSSSGEELLLGAAVDSLIVDDLGIDRRATITGRGRVAPIGAEWILDGSVELGQGGEFDVATMLRVSSLDLTDFASVLESLGVDHVVANATFESRVHAHAKRIGQTDALDMRAELTDTALTEADTVLFRIGALEADARLDGPKVTVPTASLRDVRCTQLATLSGVRISNVVAGEDATTIGSVDLEKLRVTQAGLALVADGKVGPIAPGQEIPLELEFDIEGKSEHLRIAGSLGLGDATDVELELAATGLRPGGALDGFLPPGQRIDLENGRLDLKIAANVRPRADGVGNAIRATIRDVALRDGESGEAEFGIREVLVDVPQVGAEDGPIHVRDLAVRGLTLAAVKDEDDWHVAGLRISPVETEPGVAKTDEEAPTDPTAPPTEVTMPPTVLVERVAFELSEFSVQERDTEPLRARLDLRNTAPLAVIAPEPTDLPPWQFELTASAGDALEQLLVRLEAHPWQLEPIFTAALDLRGLRGEPVHTALPSALGDLDLREIDGGHARVFAQATLQLQRRAPTEFDLSRAFGVQAEVTDLAFHATADGPELAGIDSVFLNAPRVGGGAGAIHVAELAVDGITGKIRKDEAGMHLLGLTIPPAKTKDASTSPEDVVVVDAGFESKPDKAPPPPATIRVDRVDVNGLDFEYRDDTTEPPFVMPLDELAVSVQNFRTGESNETPARFELVLGAGDAELPKRTKASSAIAGFLASAGKAIGGMSDEGGTETRPILDELVVSGAIVPSENPTGNVDVDIRGLELLAFRGPAVQSGVEIGDGVFDGTVRVKLEENNKVSVRSGFDFRDLVIDEPPGGPISTYLKLPAPLQSVLFVLKNDQDEIKVPLEIESDAGGEISGGAIAGAAVSSFGSIVTDAIASSPFRATGTVTGLLGFGEAEELPPEANVAIQFPDACIEPPDGSLEAIQPLLDVAGDDEIAVVLQPLLGLADLERAEILATPSADDQRELVEQLRQTKRELWRSRAVLSTELRTRRMLGDDVGASETLEELRGIDAEIGVTEGALDSVLALMRPRADRGKARRGRSLALEIAASRTAAVVEMLTAAGVDEERIEVRRPRLPGSIPLEQGLVALTPRRRSE